MAEFTHSNKLGDSKTQVKIIYVLIISLVALSLMQRPNFIRLPRISIIFVSSHTYKTKIIPDFQCFVNSLSHFCSQVALDPSSVINSHYKIVESSSRVEKLVYQFSKNLLVTQITNKHVYLEKTKEGLISLCPFGLVCRDGRNINRGVFRYQLSAIITTSERKVFIFRNHNGDLYQRITRGRSRLVSAYLLELKAHKKLTETVCTFEIVGEDLFWSDGDIPVGGVSGVLHFEADQNAVPGTNAAMEAGTLVVITNQVVEGNAESAQEEHPAR